MIKYCVKLTTATDHIMLLSQRQQQVLPLCEHGGLCHPSTLWSLLRVDSSDDDQCQKVTAMFEKNVENILAILPAII